jgi:DNA-binding PadR family transcriptional regulator
MSRDSFPHDPRQADESFDRAQTTRHECRHAKFPQEREVLAEARREAHADRDPRPLSEDRQRPYSLGRRTFLLRESEVQAMSDLATFRVVTADDLGQFIYAGDGARMERELRRLQKQGLIVERTLPTSGRNSLRVVGLTRTGKKLLQPTHRFPESQALYCGIVKPREAKHDAELYRLFHAEAVRIQNAGGRPLRVFLDYELKQHLNRERERLGERRNDPREIAALAARHGLTVVNGKIPLPDMRIEYQTADMELRRIDLELATGHYRPQGVAEKAKAGFAIYSPREDARRLRRILGEQKLTARIFTL